MSCVIRELPDDNEYSLEALERQLGVALVKGCDGDPQKLLVTVLDFLRRKSNFFKHGDPRKRVQDAFNSVVAEAGLQMGFTGEAASARGGAASAPCTIAADRSAAEAPGAAQVGWLQGGCARQVGGTHGKCKRKRFLIAGAPTHHPRPPTIPWHATAQGRGGFPRCPSHRSGL
jgi:hypothetical protein